jgi:WD40 repeat protein
MRTLLPTFVAAGLLVGVFGCGNAEKAGPTQGSGSGGAGLRVVSPRAQFKPTFTVKSKYDYIIPADLFLTADGKRLVACSPLGTEQTQVWSVEGEPRKTAEFDGTATLVLPDGKRALCLFNGAPSVADLETGQRTPTAGTGVYLRTPDAVVSPGISHVWDQPGRFELAVFDLKAGKTLPTLTIGKDDRARSAPPVKQGRELVYALPREDLIRVWDFDAGRVTREFKLTGGKPLGDVPNHTSWSDFRVSQPDGRWIAVSRNIGFPAEIFDGTTGALVVTLPEPLWLLGGQFVPGRDVYLTNSSVQSANGLKGIAAFSIKDQKYTSVYRSHTSEVVKLAVSGDGTVMATAHKDGAIAVWDLGPLD